LRSAAGGLNAIAMGYRAAVLQVRIHLPSSGASAANLLLRAFKRPPMAQVVLP